MQARVPFRAARISTGAVIVFVAALLAAFLLGCAGGYLVRAFSGPASTTVTTLHQTGPSQTQSIPYSTPIAPQLPERTPTAERFNSH